MTFTFREWHMEGTVVVDLLLVFSRRARKQRPSVSNSRCCFRQMLEFYGCTRKGRGGGAAEVRGQQKPSNDPRNNQHHPGTPTTGHRQRTSGTRRNQHSPGTPTTGLRERGNATSRSTGRSGRQNTATRRNMRREEGVTFQDPVNKQQPDGMSHRGATSARVNDSLPPTCMN